MMEFRVKIFGYEITTGPDPMWFVFTAGFLMWSVVNSTLWPIFYWLLFNAISVPLGILYYQQLEKRKKEKLESSSIDDSNL